MSDYSFLYWIFFLGFWKLQLPWQCLCNITGLTHCEYRTRQCYLQFAGRVLQASGLFNVNTKNLGIYVYLSAVAGYCLHVFNNVYLVHWNCFFFWQSLFYNAQTQLLSRPAVVEKIVELGTVSLGNSYQSVLKSGFSDKKSDRATRVSFKVIPLGT